MGLFLHQSNQKWRTPSTPGLSGAVFSLQAVLYLWSQIILHRSPPSLWVGRRRPSIYNRRHIPENLQYFYFSQWCSDVSQWRNCVRVKHLQWFQLEVNIDFFFLFLFSILFLMTMITFVAVLIFGGDGLSRSRLLCVKNHWCFMIHGCVSTCDCVVHVNGVATWRWQTSEEDISYSCMCLNFELLNRTECYGYHQTPLCTRAESCMKHRTWIS